MIEAVGENWENPVGGQERNVIFALGEIVRKMKDHGIWNYYGVAFPKSHLRFLKEFEVAGIQLLDLHFFIVEDVWSLYHLDSKAVVELIEHLKSGSSLNLTFLDVDFKSLDYMI